MEHHLDFDAIEEKLREQSEQYRERHLSVKPSLYAGLFAFEGIAVAAGTFVAGHSSLFATMVIGISLVAMLILITTGSCAYDDLGFQNLDQVAE